MELEALEEERELLTQVRNIDTIFFDHCKMDTWYFSPYPDEYKDVAVLHVCRWCLKYSKFNESLVKHKKTCRRKNPPGVVVYQKNDVKIYEIDGRIDKVIHYLLCPFYFTYNTNFPFPRLTFPFWQ